MKWWKCTALWIVIIVTCFAVGMWIEDEVYRGLFMSRGSLR